jgi:hypothetical protein
MIAIASYGQSSSLVKHDYRRLVEERGALGDFDNPFQPSRRTWRERVTCARISSASWYTLRNGIRWTSMECRNVLASRIWNFCSASIDTLAAVENVWPRVHQAAWYPVAWFLVLLLVREERRGTGKMCIIRSTDDDVIMKMIWIDSPWWLVTRALLRAAMLLKSSRYNVLHARIAGVLKLVMLQMRLSTSARHIARGFLSIMKIQACVNWMI